MATYTFTTTAAQDAVLQARVDAANAERAARTPPVAPLTVEQYLRALLVGLVKSWRAEDEDKLVRRAYTQPASLTTAEKSTVRALLDL